MEEERLQKIISRHGLASRRAAEELILAGRVRVNGNTARLGDTALDGEDVIEVDGVKLKKLKNRMTIMLNKPRGYVTTLCDEKGRKDVAELISDCPERVYPVGRLDCNSEGLLLLTNDGELANRLMHPKNGARKVYLLWVSHLTADFAEKLKEPIEIDGRRTKPAGVELLKTSGDTALLRMTLLEGRNRQIRRLCVNAGITPTRLKRIEEAGLKLGELPVGKWRELTQDELDLLG